MYFSPWALWFKWFLLEQNMNEWFAFWVREWRSLICLSSALCWPLGWLILDVRSQAFAKMGTGKRVCTFRRNLTYEEKIDSYSWGVEIICEGRYAWGTTDVDSQSRWPPWLSPLTACTGIGICTGIGFFRGWGRGINSNNCLLRKTWKVQKIIKK